MECSQFIIAQLVIVDNQTRTVSAINLLEDLNFGFFPAVVQCSCVTYFRRETPTDEGEMRRLVVKLDETIVLNVELILNFFGNHLLAKNVANIGNIVVSNSGRLSFQLIKPDNTIEKEYQIRIGAIQSVPSQTSPGSPAVTV